MDLNGIRSRLARIAATVAPPREGEPVSVRMYNGLSRADALASLWNDERRDAARTARQPDPQRVLDFLRLFDSVTHPCMIRQGHWSHTKPTSFAFDFAAWTLAEVCLFAKLGDIGGAGRLTTAELEMLGGMETKLETLGQRAEAIWASDEETMRFLTTRGEPC
jgi:hypothetical protein